MLSLEYGSHAKAHGQRRRTGSTREAVLAAALCEFSQKGFAGTTTKEIAALAGVAEVTLFRHFISKERLFEETLKRHSFVAEFEEILAELDALPYREALTRLAHRLFEALHNYREWILVMHAEVRRHHEVLLPLYHGFLDQLFGQLAHFFEQRQERGEIRLFDVAYAARAVHGIIFSLFNVEVVLMRNRYRPINHEQAIRAFIDLLCNGTLAH